MRSKNGVRHRFGVCATLVLISLFSSRTQGQIQRESGSSDWFGGALRVTSSYNDNLFEYSPGDVEQFTSGARPEKFSMERPQDLVTSIRARVLLSPDLLPRNPTQIRLRFGTASHAHNPIRNYLSTGVEFRQYVQQKNYLFAGYTLVPRYYLRNISFRNLSLPPRLWLSYAEVFLSRQTFTLGLARNLTSRLNVSADYSYSYVRYSRELMERDSRIDEVDLDGSMKLFPWLRVDAGYQFSYATARGRELSDTLSDLTSRAHRVQSSANIYLRGLTGKPLTLSIDAVFEYQQYLSLKKYDAADRSLRYGDRYHYGRQDHLWRVVGELSYDLTDYLECSCSYAWEQNRTNLTETGDAGSYQTHVASLSVEVSF